jgi:hypothetical protein
MTNAPHVQTVGITFVKKPDIDYVLKPIGGEHFGFDIANVRRCPNHTDLYLCRIRFPDYLRLSEI